MLRPEKYDSDILRLLLGGDFGIILSEIIDRHSSIRIFLAESLDKFEKDKDNLQIRINSDPQKAELDISSDIIGKYDLESELRYILVYDLLFNGVFVYTYSLFEIGLKLFYLEAEKKIYKKDINIKNGYPENIRDAFRAQNPAIDIEQLSHWSTLNDLRKIRNYITHKNSVIETKGKSLRESDDYKLIKKYQEQINIFEPMGDFRIFSKDLNEMLMECSRIFFLELKEKLDAISPES